MSITPQDTFNVGDTIWCEMQLPQKLWEQNSGDYVDLKDFNLYFEMSVSRWDSSQIRGAMLEFELIQSIGKITQYINSFVYTYVEFESTTNRYFRFGLVPTKAGKYNFGIDFPEEYFEKEELPANDPERFRLTDSPCSQFMVKHSGVRINDGAINYYLIDGFCPPSVYSGEPFCMAPYEVVANDGIYVFVVQ